MAASLARLGLRSVKQVRVQFCPFEKNVESTRTFLQAVSSEKVRSTNLNCSVIADVRHDGSEPCVEVLFGGLGRRASPDYARRPPHRPGNAHSLCLPHPGEDYGGERGQARTWYRALTAQKSPTNRF
ncbi:large ribosomal subunit protein mL53 isoform X1 [Vulpes vulpes]|uniref:Large ribosomal subunit protein mL53 n=1 Tax=Vulpes vulpes TaxID=9627 RepID=A0ABM5B7U0_VULVU